MARKKQSQLDRYKDQQVLHRPITWYTDLLGSICHTLNNILISTATFDYVTWSYRTTKYVIVMQLCTTLYQVNDSESNINST